MEDDATLWTPGALDPVHWDLVSERAHGSSVCMVERYEGDTRAEGGSQGARPSPSSLSLALFESTRDAANGRQGRRGNYSS
jgi:hypothetical protein